MAYGGTNEAWIVGAVRTPVGRHGGALSPVRPDDLGAVALEALMERTGVPPSEIEDVYMGCANQAGEDNRDVARMSLLLAGFPVEVGGTTINRLCGSGLDAVANASRAIMLGEAHAYIGGGVESMSRAPFALPKPERAFPTGHTTLYDTTLGWRFVNPKMEALGHTDSLGMTAENLAQERYLLTPDENEPDRVAEDFRVSREEQDHFALRSHQKAVAAIDEKRFRDEIVPVPVKSRKGETLVEADEGPRRETSLDKLAKLKPAFKEGGSVTAGNSSSLNDGAAADLVVSAEYARAHGLEPMAKVRSIGVAGVPPRVMGIGPVPATNKALGRAGISLDDVGLVELNEACAAQVLACMHEWGMDSDDESSIGTLAGEENPAWHSDQASEPPLTGAMTPTSILLTSTSTTRRRALGRPSGRSPHLPLGARPRGTRAADLLFRFRDYRAGVGVGIPLRHHPARTRGDADGEPPMTPEPTPSQTIGPFFHFALPYPGGEYLVSLDDPDAVRIVGAVYDGAGEPVQDAMVEIWQANRAGRFAHPEDRREHLPLQEGFTGFGRCPTDAEGRFEFLTVKPGAVPGPDGRPQAPHINVAIFARGLLRQLVTRVYFPDEEEANAADPVLSSIEDPNLRSTLIARQLDGAFEFDIHLRGDRENAFFDL